MRPVRFLAVLALAGCTAEAARTSAVTRDSAGVRIVEHDASAFARAPIWSLSPKPQVDIGSADADSVYELFRVSGATRLSSGEIVVANAGTQQLRIFGTDGKHIRSIGRKGSGPGEFQFVNWVAVGPGDSLIVYDGSTRKVAVFDRDGHLGRSFMIEMEGVRFPQSRFRLPDGSMLLSTSTMFTPGSPSGVSRDTSRLVRLSATGKPLGDVGRFRGSESFVQSSKNSVSVSQRAFGKGLEMAADDSLIFIGETDAYEIRGYSLDGKLRRVMRVATVPGKVTPDVIEAYKQQQLASVTEPQWKEFFTRMVAAMTFPETMPAHSTLRTDSEGLLWVRDYPVHPDSTPPWRVFGRDGTLVATVSVPAKFVMQTIGRDWVLGTWKDESDVEHVRLYALTRRSQQDRD